MRQTVVTIAVLVLCVGAISAQGPGPEPDRGRPEVPSLDDQDQHHPLGEKMPEENYAFKPTPEVRSFGQLIAHVADAQYAFCSPVLGKSNPAPGIEKSKTTKADLVQA